MKAVWGLAVATALVVASPVRAAPVFLNDTAYQTLNSGDTGLFLASLQLGDVFKFHLPNISSKAVDSAISITGSLDSLSLVKLGLGTVTPEATLVNTGNVQAFKYSGLGIGDYEIHVAWSPLRDYSGNITVAAVPLPAALPLFAVGLGGLGLLLRRRRAEA